MGDMSVFKGARVLLTGHTGFKGTWLSLWLNKLGAQVHGLSLCVPSEPSHFIASSIGSQLKDNRIDIRDGFLLKALVNEIQPNFVFHLAAQPLVRRSYADPLETWQTNTIGTINVLEALRLLKDPCVAVFITSDKCYDNVEWIWGYRESDSLGGPDPYSASKGAAEIAIQSYVRSFFPGDGVVRIGVARAGNVIGGGDWADDRIVPDCMRSWSRGEMVMLRNPFATRPWQHVLEPLSGYLSLAMALKQSSRLHGEPFNFGPPAQQNNSVGELVSTMGKHLHQLHWKDVSEEYSGPYESSLLKLNCDKALHYLNWRATWDFEVTVRETALWYRNYYENPKKSMASFSIGQITKYIQAAKLMGIAWAK
jgi:CDP-glucose 4,6-dehydratase